MNTHQGLDLRPLVYWSSLTGDRATALASATDAAAGLAGESGQHAESDDDYRIDYSLRRRDDRP